MDGRFFDYGLNWLQWNDVPNHIAHDIVKRGTPKPGDHFLPSVGMCDIHEALNDKRGIYIDKYVFYNFVFVIFTGLYFRFFVTVCFDTKYFWLIISYFHEK